MESGHFHAGGVTRPLPAVVEGVSEAHDMVVVGQPHADAPVRIGRTRPHQFFGVLLGLRGVGGEADADKGLTVIKQRDAAFGIADQLQGGFGRIGTIGHAAGQRCAVDRRRQRRPASARCSSAASAPARPAWPHAAPLRAEAVGRKIVRQGKAGRHRRRAGRREGRARSGSGRVSQRGDRAARTAAGVAGASPPPTVASRWPLAGPELCVKHARCGQHLPKAQPW